MNKKVEWDIIVPIKLPISLKNVEPGKLHPSLLRDIPQGGKLHYLAADAWNAMVDAAKKDGIELKPTALNFSWASLESEKCEQIAFCVSQIMFSSLPNLLNIEDLPLPLAPTIKPIP